MSLAILLTAYAGFQRFEQAGDREEAACENSLAARCPKYRSTRSKRSEVSFTYRPHFRTSSPGPVDDPVADLVDDDGS